MKLFKVMGICSEKLKMEIYNYRFRNLKSPVIILNQSDKKQLKN
jgi:hypothetical protein